MRRAFPLSLSVLVALAVPAILLGNGLWVLMGDWYVHAEYARPGFPDDRYGFTSAQRTELALVGLESIHPLDQESVAVLRDARLPDGGVAFTEREVAHMSDVRALVGSVLLAHLAALAAVLVAFIAVRLLDLRGVLARGFLAGGVLTLGLAAAIVGYMLADFDSFFVRFHAALFPGDTWRFASSDTLIRLYPDAFWSDFGAVLGGLTVAQALVLTGALWWARRHQRAVLPAARPRAATGGRTAS